jgi:D-alanyl-D-alanine carboxypeptidase
LARAATTIFAALLAWALCAAPAAAGSALLFDTENGHVLYAEDPDAPWYPASLTKMMTAYLAFEAIRDHKASEDTDVVVSENARKQPPSRLGVKVGTHLTLGDALKALIMRSANDIAVAIAETLGGGDEMAFVKQMNQKAVELGMMHTHFINPNGLPAEQQVTTARDLALLAQALLRDFPERVPLYAEIQTTIGKNISISTHNAILTNYPGGDGIKTGFTCASGYNLAASATRDGHKLVAILLGEESGAKRTARAAALLDHGFRTREWKAIYPTPRVENLPSDIVGWGFEPSASLLERYRVCAAPPPPPKETASAAPGSKKTITKKVVKRHTHRRRRRAAQN